jgi:hypothetical protein
MPSKRGNMVEVVPRQVRRRLVTSAAGRACRRAAAAAAGVGRAVAADGAAAGVGLDRGSAPHHQTVVSICGGKIINCKSVDR